MNLGSRRALGNWHLEAGDFYSLLAKVVAKVES